MGRQTTLAALRRISKKFGWPKEIDTDATNIHLDCGDLDLGSFHGVTVHSTGWSNGDEPGIDVDIHALMLSQTAAFKKFLKGDDDAGSKGDKIREMYRWAEKAVEKERVSFDWP